MRRVTRFVGMSLTVLACCAFCFACKRTPHSKRAQPKLAASQAPIPVVNGPVQTPPSATATPQYRPSERSRGIERWAEFFDSLGEQTWVTAPFMRPSDWHRVGERSFGVKVLRAHIDTSEGLSLWLTWALPDAEAIDAQRTVTATSIRVTGPGVDSTVRLQTCPRARSFEELPVIIAADGQLRSHDRAGHVKLADARLPFPLAPGQYRLHVMTRMLSETLDGKRTATGHAVVIPLSVRERRDGRSALDPALAKAQTYLESRLPTGRKLKIERAVIQDFSSGEMLATFDLEGTLRSSAIFPI
jgi:hypothetical protein